MALESKLVIRSGNPKYYGHKNYKGDGSGGLVGWWPGSLVGWWVGGLVAWGPGGLVAWWLGGLGGWWPGGLVAWGVGGLGARCLLYSGLIVCPLSFVVDILFRG